MKSTNESSRPASTQHAASQPPTISSFRGEFWFLSNFYAASIWVDGERYATVEHAYQAAKTDDPASRRLIREAATPAIAKRLGRCCGLAPDWDSRRLGVMLDLVRKKFENPLLRAMLLATEDAVLVEGNTWNDTFWGVCRGRGENWLGRILMQVREECRQQST